MLNKIDNLQWNIIFITKKTFSSRSYNLVGSTTFPGWGLCKTDQFASITKEDIYNYLVCVAFLLDRLAWTVRRQVPLRTNNLNLDLPLPCCKEKYYWNCNFHVLHVKPSNNIHVPFLRIGLMKTFPCVNHSFIFDLMSLTRSKTPQFVRVIIKTINL